MALYFFHTRTDSRYSDAEGTEFTTATEARAQAIITCGQMMKDAPNSFWGSRPWSVVVTDAAGLILWELSVDGFASPAALEIQ